VQDVAPAELQVSIEEPPEATLVGETLRLAVGIADKGLTVTDALATGLVPPGPEQVNAKVEFVVSAPVLREPLTASVPLQLPDAVHVVACADDQASVDALPAVTLVGFALSVAVGGSLTMMVTLTGWLSAPAPAHVSENVVSSPSIPVLRLPLGAKVPLQPPEAVQEVALAEDQVSVAEPPGAIVVLDARRDATGNAVTGAEPPPQADRADAAPRAQSEEMNRMES
jgi:hypothetical protein